MSTPTKKAKTEDPKKEIRRLKKELKLADEDFKVVIARLNESAKLIAKYKAERDNYYQLYKISLTSLEIDDYYKRAFETSQKSIKELNKTINTLLDMLEPVKKTDKILLEVCAN